MTIKDFATITQSPIKVMSGYNGKVLAKRFNAEKHSNIAAREVLSVWSEIEVYKGGGFSQLAHPIICAFVEGSEEYVKERAEKGGEG